ncbi:MAG TPA: DUF6712 family protein [Candidatus Babeliaceae bacterium]|nr:DUF6712 family protein [Candidatus Babeliaceae bacterium]
MLFKNVDKLLEYAELSASINFASVKATIRIVETNYIIPFIGADLYTSLNTNFTNASDESSLSDSDKNLLDMCRCVIGPLLCYHYIAKAEVKLSDAGAQRIESGSNKTAYQNQVVNFREQNLREGEMAIEQLLQFLDANTNVYPSWQTSTAFQSYKSLFIKSGGEFNELFPCHSPYRNYWAMRSKMLDVEENNIRSLIGDTIFDNLKSKDQALPQNFTDKEKTLLSKVKRVIAYLTVSYSIPFLNVRLDANGITIMSPSGRAQDDQLAKRGNASDPALNAIIQKSEESGRAWADNVVKYLDDNASDFEGWPLTQVENNENDDNDCNSDYRENNCSGSYGLI